MGRDRYQAGSHTSTAQDWHAVCSTKALEDHAMVQRNDDAEEMRGDEDESPTGVPSLEDDGLIYPGTSQAEGERTPEDDNWIEEPE
jgi:hypothetical protein